MRDQELVMPREELMLYQVLTTISVVMNILMDTVLDTKSAMVLETSYREPYTIGLK
jgi:hypothetical protein